MAVECLTSQRSTQLCSLGPCSELAGECALCLPGQGQTVLFIPRCSDNIHSPFNPFSVLATFRIGCEAEQGTGDFSLLDTTTGFPPRTARFH